MQKYIEEKAVAFQNWREGTEKKTTQDIGEDSYFSDLDLYPQLARILLTLR